MRSRLAATAADLHRRSQLRELTHAAGINFSSNDYLGLVDSPHLQEAARQGIAITQRVGATGSRLLSGNAREWEELETEVAAFAGTESALYFNSGYAANIGVLSSLLQKGNLVFSDSLNHASIIDGIRLSGASKEIYPHADLNALESALKKHEASPCAKVIVTESIFSMDGDRAPLAGMLTLARRYGAEMIVDEAHATAVHGPAGRGLCAELGIEQEMLAIIHTCGKALASVGAFVSSDALVKQHLINHARTFIFSTAMPPYLAHQIRAALQLAKTMDAERKQLA